MDSSFRSLSRGKRSRQNNSSSADSKRAKLPPPPLTVSAGDILFRLLCPVPLSGGVIGKSGAVVRQLQTDTSSKIRVEEPPPASDDRAVVIIASKTLSRKIKLTDKETAEVSAAQEAVVRVFERMVEVMGETDEVVGDETVVTCRMLVETSQVGGVIGKGGKVIEKIRRDSFCKISVSNPGNNLSACALPNEQMLEMEGNVLAVKRALLAITGRLQECPPLETANVTGNRPYQTSPTLNFPNFDAEYPPARKPVAPPSSYPYGPRGHYSTEMCRPPALDPRAKQEEVVFRILCSKDRIGGVIGKGGTIVNALQDETGAAITASGSVPGCDERLITISANENPESQFSPAQNAIVLVFNRSIEAGYEKGLHSASNKIVSARLVVPGNQVGCLIGNGGSFISDMRRTTGAGIQIAEHNQLPRCATEKDEVVEITGEFVNVQDALYKVTSRLRHNLFSSYRIPNGDGAITNSVITGMNLYGRARDPTLGLNTFVGVFPTINPHAAYSQNMDHIRPPHGYDQPPMSRPWTSQAVGVNQRRITDVGGMQLGSGSRSAIVTNTTVEIVVPNNVVGSVYGVNGSNLARLRQISGATVAVHEPHPGHTDWTIVISGTPDETQAAQSLVQAFILTGQP